MTLNGVIALILLYFTEFDSFEGLYYVTMVEDRPDLSAEYRLPLFTTSDSPCRLARSLSDSWATCCYYVPHNWFVCCI